jgi:hypothetical protein
VTVIVVVAIPSAVTMFGEALMPPAAAGGTAKTTTGFCSSTTPSVTFVAVNVTVSAVSVLTVKIALPV